MRYWGFIVVVVLLIALSTTAQDKEAKLFFKDGTSVTGYAKLKDKRGFTSGSGKILFRLSKEDEPDEWDHKAVDKIKFFGFEYYKTFVYVKARYKSYTGYYLLELITEGEVNLYKKTSYGETSNFNFNVGNFNLETQNKHGMREYRESNIYVVKRDSELKLMELNDRKKIIEYFKDCPNIKKGLDEKEFKVSDLRDIVEYYNESCSTYISDKNNLDTIDELEFEID